MDKTIIPSRIPKMIGLCVGLILSILFSSWDIAYAAGAGRVGPERTVEKSKPYYGVPGKPEDIYQYRKKPDLKIFPPDGKKEKGTLNGIGKPIESDRSKPEWGRPTEKVPPLEKPKSRSISKEVAEEFESLSIEKICEDKTPQLSPTSVESVQRVLNELTGSNLKVDGRLGPLTREAIRQFQLSRGLGANGRVDRHTARQLVAETVISGETMFHISVSSGSGQCRIIRSSDPQRPASGNFDDMTPVDSIGDLAAYVGDGPSKVPRTQIERSSGKGGREFRRRRPALNAWDDEHRLLFVSGAELPFEWKRALEARGVRTVRISDQSPKRLLKDHQKAARLANKSLPADAQILSTLPRARSESEMIMKLRNMNLSEGEMQRWLSNSSKFDKLEREYEEKFPESKESFKERNKQEILEKLSGDSDILFLIGHLEKGILRLDNGETISGTEIDGLKRKSTGPRGRVIIVVGCEAGALNQEVKSLGQRLIDKDLADLVIAPSGLVSAEEIPGKFRELFFEKKPLSNVFQSYIHMTQFHPCGNDVSRVMNSDPWRSHGVELGEDMKTMAKEMNARKYSQRGSGFLRGTST